MSRSRRPRVHHNSRSSHKFSSTRLPRPKRLSGSSSSTVRCSHPARRHWPLEECQQPAGGCCFTGQRSNSHSSRAAGRRRRRGTADGQPSTQRCPTTTSLSTTTASQHCAHHQLQPGRRVDSVNFQKKPCLVCVFWQLLPKPARATTSFTIPSSCSSVVPSVHFMSIHSAVLLRKIIFRARDSSPE